MKNTLSKALRKNAAIGTLAAASLTHYQALAQDTIQAPSQSPAQEISVNGNLKWFQKAQTGTSSYPEYNVWVSGLPGKANIYSWMDFNMHPQRNDRYFGKTEVGVPVSKTVEALGQIVHANEPLNQAGLGLKFNIPMDPKRNAYANVKVLPVWTTKEGTMMPGRALVGYAAGKDFGNGWDLSTFAEFDVSGPQKEKFSGKRHFHWGYGEIELNRQMRPNLKLGVNAGLYNQGKDKLPEARARIQARYDFDAKVKPFWHKFAK